MRIINEIQSSPTVSMFGQKYSRNVFERPEYKGGRVEILVVSGKDEETLEIEGDVRAVKMFLLEALEQVRMLEDDWIEESDSEKKTATYCSWCTTYYDYLREKEWHSDGHGNICMGNSRIRMSADYQVLFINKETLQPNSDMPIGLGSLEFDALFTMAEPISDFDRQIFCVLQPYGKESGVVVRAFKTTKD